MLYKIYFDGYYIIDAASEEDAIEKALANDRDYIEKEINELETVKLNED